MMNEIINLTQHAATDDQIAAGVFDLSTAVRVELQALLTFNSLPDDAEILKRAEKISGMVVGYGAKSAMIGGALWLMAPLASALREQGIKPVFAFSVRETEEQKQADGSIRKVAVFRHAGFVPAWCNHFHPGGSENLTPGE